MHLLQSGVDSAVIALWLGHENIQTTSVYITADLASKQRALQRLDPVSGTAGRYRPSDKLLAFLASLRTPDVGPHQIVRSSADQSASATS
jgi:integrase/recombinase XerD